MKQSFAVLLNPERDVTHWGILGMKWGVRRFQNKDGSLTAAGRERYKTQLQSDIANAAKSDGRPASNMYTKSRGAADISSKVKTQDSDFKSAVSDFKSWGDKISDEYNEVCKIAENEAKQAIKNPDFKKDLDKKLFEGFGNGCDDEEFFEWERDAIIKDLLESPKYAPESNKKMSEIKAEIDTYYAACKRTANAITASYGDETVANIKGEAVKYKDVVEDMIHRGAKSEWVSYLYRSGEDYLFEEIDGFEDLASSLYTMDEYNKKYVK